MTNFSKKKIISQKSSSSSSGGSNPAGNNKNVQYNNSGSFAGSDNFTYDGSKIILKNISGGIISGTSCNFLDIIGDIIGNTNLPGIRFVGGNSTTGSSFPYIAVNNGGISLTAVSGNESGNTVAYAINGSYGFYIVINKSGTVYYPIVTDVITRNIFIDSNNTTLALGTSILHIGAGAAGVGKASFKINDGTRTTTPEAGTKELEKNHYNTNTSLVRYGLGGTIKDFLTDVATTTSTAETDIYTYTTLANTLNVNGDKVLAEYGFQLTSTGGVTKQIRAYFAGTLIFDSGSLSISASTDFCLDLFVIRDSSTTVRCIAKANTTGASTNAFAKVTKITGLTLSNTNIIKVTGTVGVGAVAGDITGICGMVEIKAKGES